MHHIYCPYCEEIREEEEYSYTGEAHIERPKDPQAISDDAWADYIFFRTNPRGIHHEMWYHAAGCRRYFNATRDTQSYEIHETYKMGELPTFIAPTKSAPTKSAQTSASQRGDAS